jgi:hypothetical protein
VLGHASAGLTLDRYGPLYGSDVEAVGVAPNALLTADISGPQHGQISVGAVVGGRNSPTATWGMLWSLGDSNP